MGAVPQGPLELDDLSRRLSLERALQIAVGLVLAMCWVRLWWLWSRGVARSEPFLGSPAWTAAILGPGLISLAVWQAFSLRCRRAVALRLRALTQREPLRTWRRRIASRDWWLELGMPRNVSPLVREIVTLYPELDAEGRDAVRALWRAYPSFAENAGLSETPTNADSVRRALMLFSIRDQRADRRDEVVGLANLATKAGQAGVDIAPLAREVAMLSDDSHQKHDRHSTRELLLRYAERG